MADRFDEAALEGHLEAGTTSHEGHRTLRLRDGRLLDEHGWATPKRQTTSAA